MSTVWRYRKKNGSREGRRIISGLICSRVADAEAAREYGIRTARQNRAVFAGGGISYGGLWGDSRRRSRAAGSETVTD